MWRIATIGVLVLVLAAACASGTKYGGTVTHPITIVMQGPGSPDANSDYFISQVRKRSGGRIRIVLGSKYSTLHASNEPRLVHALRSGRVKMAYIASRAWEEASRVTAFRALQAPLLVDNYPLLRRITTGPIGHSMLASLNAIGIVGLGLVPERLRRLLGRKPLDSAATLHGARIRSASPSGDRALRALGAVPVTIDNTTSAGPALASGRIVGVESETISIDNNNYENYAHDLTSNVALFAKATTIAIRKSLFDQLSAADRSILRTAAKATVARANPAVAERADVKTLCRQGIKLLTATHAELASLERLAPPAYERMERDPTSRRNIQAIERLKKTTPVAASNLPACPRAVANRTGSSNDRLAGTYVVNLSKSEIAKASGGQPDENWGSFRLSLGNGRFRMSDSRPAGDLVQEASHGYSEGTYAVQGDRITFTSVKAAGDTPLGGRGDAPVICRWSRYRDELTFEHLLGAAHARAAAQGLDPGGPPLLYVKPWQKAQGGSGGGFPTGTYETKITPADVARISGPAWWAHWETLTYTKNGTFTDVWFHPRRADQPTTRGRYRIHGDRLYTFGHGSTDVFRWSYYRGQLTLKIVNAPDLDQLGHLIVNTHPWRKIS
jgi:TRAP-type C4-dicarboxylate transport system substrate-binding protein